MEDKNDENINAALDQSSGFVKDPVTKSEPLKKLVTKKRLIVAAVIASLFVVAMIIVIAYGGKNASQNSDSKVILPDATNDQNVETDTSSNADQNGATKEKVKEETEAGFVKSPGTVILKKDKISLTLKPNSKWLYETKVNYKRNVYYASDSENAYFMVSKTSLTDSSEKHGEVKFNMLGSKTTYVLHDAAGEKSIGNQSIYNLLNKVSENKKNVLAEYGPQFQWLFQASDGPVDMQRMETVMNTSGSLKGVLVASHHTCCSLDTSLTEFTMYVVATNGENTEVVYANLKPTDPEFDALYKTVLDEIKAKGLNESSQEAQNIYDSKVKTYFANASKGIYTSAVQTQLDDFIRALTDGAVESY